MRLRFLSWFLFLSCTIAISTSVFHRNLSSSEQRVLNSSNSNMQTRQPFDNYGSKEEAFNKLHKKDEESNNEEKSELSCDTIEKALRGKGVTGGGNVNHHPRHSRNSPAPLLSSSSTVRISLTLMLVYSFHAGVL
ncbi:hypothetical protein RIF29_28493 [Crotalaria pallida]|uniref:Uncharacterized protein n=1 Tax=Crotalaria pallida TaxID=3830 RepID=A0AAN9EI16_CROPI